MSKLHKCLIENIIVSIDDSLFLDMLKNEQDHTSWLHLKSETLAQEVNLCLLISRWEAPRERGRGEDGEEIGGTANRQQHWPPPTQWQRQDVGDRPITAKGWSGSANKKRGMASSEPLPLSLHFIRYSHSYAFSSYLPPKNKHPIHNIALLQEKASKKEDMWPAIA